MKALSKFLPYVLPHVQGCTQTFAEMTLRQSADEFCRESRALRETPEEIGIVPGQTEVDLAPDGSGVVILDVADVEISGQPLEAFERNSAGIFGKKFYTLRKSNRETWLILKEPPARAGRLTLSLILVPEDTAPGLPDSLFDDWREAIVSGTLVRLITTPNQPFTNPELVQYHQGRFRRGVAAAIAKATLGGFKATLRTIPDYWP
jgi:hypothetical protein